MKILCAIIDDEPLAAALLEGYVRKISYLKLVGVYNSAITALKDLRDKDVQLLFLDIQMPELDGIEFAKIVTKGVRVIFTTAFPEYAIEGYKVDALDYLLKPIAFEDFEKSAEKALEWFNMKKKQDIYLRDRFVLLKSDYKLVRLNLDEILYAEGVRDYIRFYLRNGETLLSLMQIKKLEEILPPPEFIRVHRSFMVHLPDVIVFEHNRVMVGDVSIPVSERYKSRIQDYLEQHTWN